MKEIDKNVLLKVYIDKELKTDKILQLIFNGYNLDNVTVGQFIEEFGCEDKKSIVEYIKNGNQYELGKFGHRMSEINSGIIYSKQGKRQYENLKGREK